LASRARFASGASSRAALAVVALVAAVVGVGVLLIAGGGGGEHALRASTITVGLSTFDVIEDRPELAAREGVRIEVVRFQVPPQSIDALIKGEVQLTVIPVELAGRAMLLGGDVYIVALDNMMNQAIIAPAGSGIESPEDLRGKRVAAVVGSGTYFLFKAFMKLLYNINVDEENPAASDVVVVNVKPGEVIDAILRGSADAGVIWDPVVSLAVAKYDMVIVASYQDLWRELTGSSLAPMLVWVARAEVVEDPQILIAVLKAHKAAAETWNSEEDYIVNLLTRLYGLDPEVARLVWERNQMYTGLCITEELARQMVRIWEILVDAGYLDSMPGGLERIVTCRDVGVSP
jgi:NitT/TauT family transport system substrate-binding protein